MFVIPVDEFDSQFSFGYDIMVKKNSNLNSVSVHGLKNLSIGKPKGYVEK